ncbi:beta-lactamase/transpeptidase-like protein [Mycena latifolia]|nr:beta-lactamase/transpeptidase-like protein [Mycena latifolia]
MSPTRLERLWLTSMNSAGTQAMISFHAEAAALGAERLMVAVFRRIPARTDARQLESNLTGGLIDKLAFVYIALRIYIRPGFETPTTEGAEKKAPRGIETFVHGAIVPRCDGLRAREAIKHSQPANPSKRSDAAQILTPEVDAFINNVLTEWNTPGGAGVAVVRMDGQGGWRIETKGYGFAKADSTKLFDILTTGLLISNTSLNPQISWATKIASIIPEWELMDPVASSESTITDLMSHRTGLPAHNFGFFLFNNIFSSVCIELGWQFKRMKYLKPSTGFREDTQYNNIMYAVLSYLPTALLPDKPPFAQYVKKHIFEPLGMNSSTYSFAIANATGKMADGFARQGVNVTENPLGAGTTRILPYLFPTAGEDGDVYSGDGGVMTTIVDAARWLQLLLLNGQHPDTGATIIPAEVTQKVATGVSIWQGNEYVLSFFADHLLTHEFSDAGQFPGAPELSPAVYGGAQAQTSYRGHVMNEHEGDLPGYHSRITRFPNDGVGIAIFTNDDNAGPLLKEVLKFRIADEAFGLDPVDWKSRYKAAAQELQLAAAALISTPAPPNASPPFKFTAVQGKYRNLGYGADIELCAAAATAHEHSSCATLVAHMKRSVPAELAAADLVWAWNRQLAGFGALKHFNGALFNLTAWVEMPTGNSSDSVWAYTSLQANVAEFVVNLGKVAGFGIRGGLWGAGDLAGEPQGRTVEARSEVWYSALST